MAKLIFEHNNEEEELPDGSPIAEVCENAGVPFACTEGICGTCVIEVIEGEDNLSPQTTEEEEFLGQGCCSERLACQCKIMKGSARISF